MEKFIVITKYDSYIIEATGFDTAVEEAYDNHTGYDDILAIMRALEED